MIFGNWEFGTKKFLMRSFGSFGGFERREWQNEDVVVRRMEVRAGFGLGEDVIVYLGIYLKILWAVREEYE